MPLIADTLSDLVGIVAEDTGHARYLVSNHDTPYNRRSLFRTFFAGVEGITYTLKQELLLEAGSVGYSPEEIAPLRDEGYSINAKGEASVTTKYLPTELSLLFALKLFTITHDERFTPNTKSSGWKSFVSSLRVRHRLTHPKRAEDLQVSDDELRRLESAIGWFTSSVTNAWREEARLKSREARALRLLGKHKAKRKDPELPWPV